MGLLRLLLVLHGLHDLRNVQHHHRQLVSKLCTPCRNYSYKFQAFGQAVWWVWARTMVSAGAKIKVFVRPGLRASIRCSQLNTERIGLKNNKSLGTVQELARVPELRPTDSLHSLLHDAFAVPPTLRIAGQGIPPWLVLVLQKSGLQPPSFLNQKSHSMSRTLSWHLVLSHRERKRDRARETESESVRA